VQQGGRDRECNLCEKRINSPDLIRINSPDLIRAQLCRVVHSFSSRGHPKAIAIAQRLLADEDEGVQAAAASLFRDVATRPGLVVIEPALEEGKETFFLWHGEPVEGLQVTKLVHAL